MQESLRSLFSMKPAWISGPPFSRSRVSFDFLAPTPGRGLVSSWGFLFHWAGVRACMARAWTGPASSFWQCRTVPMPVGPKPQSESSPPPRGNGSHCPVGPRGRRSQPRSSSTSRGLRACSNFSCEWQPRSGPMTPWSRVLPRHRCGWPWRTGADQLPTQHRLRQTKTEQEGQGLAFVPASLKSTPAPPQANVHPGVRSRHQTAWCEAPPLSSVTSGDLWPPPRASWESPRFCWIRKEWVLEVPNR